MPRDYRKILRERGFELGSIGRPSMPPTPDRIRSLWNGMTETERAEFMNWAGLVDSPEEDLTIRPR